MNLVPIQYFNITERHNGDDCCYKYPYKVLGLKIITKFSMIEEPLLFKISCMKIQIQGIFIPSKLISFFQVKSKSKTFIRLQRILQYSFHSF